MNKQLVKKTPLVTIIMPVYNTGDILKKTVNSILNQIFQDFELIIVDDGSNEETASLCDYYSGIDDRVRVFHRKNSGVSAARNFGIRNSNGKYITFCDHDDIYDAETLKEEVCLIQQSKGFDMSVVGALHINDGGRQVKFGKNAAFSSKEDIVKNTAAILKSGMLGTVWNILYRRDLLGETRFDENLKKGHEDIVFNIDILNKSNSINATDKVLYTHYIRKTMSTSAGFHKETVEAMRVANNRIYELCETVIDKIDALDYIDLQGEYIRIFSTYLVHLKSPINEFKNEMQSLQYIPVRFSPGKMILHWNKDSFCYYCVLHNRVRILYYSIILSNLLKR